MAQYIGGKPWPSSITITRPTASAGGRGAPTGGVLGDGGMNPAASAAIKKAQAYYARGGGFGKGVEAGLERGRIKATASGAQALVSSGLAGTTMMAGLGKKFEEEVAMPTRARVEETRAGALSGLSMAEAQIIQGATEADRARALQEYMAQLSMMNSGGGGSRGPSLTRSGVSPTLRTPKPGLTAAQQRAGYVYPAQPYKSLISAPNGGSGGTYDSPSYSGGGSIFEQNRAVDKFQSLVDTPTYKPLSLRF